MAVLVDTGPFLALINEADPWHDQAMTVWKQLRSGRHGRVLSTDLVAVEAMNFLARRPAKLAPSRRMWDYYAGKVAPVAWLSTPPETLRTAGDLHLREFKRGISLTDASLVVHATSLGASVATLDRGFDGLVPVVAA